MAHKFETGHDQATQRFKVLRRWSGRPRTAEGIWPTSTKTGIDVV